MGQEIADSHFSEEDFAAFRARLEAETELLGRWFREGGLADHQAMGGFELEAWLVDEAGRPAPLNEPFLERLAQPLVVPELARFNVELNGTPQRLVGTPLSALYDELCRTWGRCNRVAAGLGARMCMVGILPSLRHTDLEMANMSPMRRYRALNEQVFRLRRGAPVVLDIRGRDHLRLRHPDVMLEAAATSFQIHLKVGPERAARFYNASKILSAPMVALSANSPYLFGHDLWDETRIPLFEQAVAVGGSDYSQRVTFGIRYAERSLFECFEANRDRYPILLPRLMDEPLERLPHLRLHNGTIWRWNRPLVGFDADGRPHLRIEHRVAPAGPTPADAIANAAFYFGLVADLAEGDPPPERRLDFAVAQQNFYAAARDGLDARLTWTDGARGDAASLLAERLLPQAARGLRRLGLDGREIEHWLGILRGRVESRHNGAGWQRAWVARHGAAMQALTLDYIGHQESGMPVHQW